MSSTTNKLITAYQDGYTVAQSARYAGLGRKAAANILRENGIHIRQNNNRQQTIWTEQQDALLREMHQEGYSASLIADSINRQHGTAYTRNSIIGRKYRLGLKGHARQAEKTKAPTPRHGRSGSRARNRKVTLAKTAEHLNAGCLPPQPATEPGRSYPSPDSGPAHLSSDSAPIGLMDLTNTTCRWPVSETPEGEHLFCGAPADPSWERPYCAFHEPLATNPPKAKERGREAA